MDADEFWSMVDSSAASLNRRTPDGDAVAAALTSRLANASPDTILAFGQQFDRLHGALYRWDVWAAAYLIGGGCSDDSFSDFRAGVIALGRDWYERVLTSPDALAGHPLVSRATPDGSHDAVFAESMNYVAAEAFEKATGDRHGFYEAREPHRQDADERPDPGMGEEFDFDDEGEMRRRLPQLAELFLGRAID